EPRVALVVGMGLIPFAEEVVGVVAAVVPADPDLAVRQHAHPGVKVVLVSPDGVAVDLDRRRPGGPGVGRAPEQRVAVVARAPAAAIGARGLQVAARVDHVDVAGIGRADAHDGMAARAEALSTSVDAEDATPGLRADARAALHDAQFRHDAPGCAAVGRAGDFIAHPGGAAGVLVVILLVADVDPAVGGHARLARLLVARRGDGVADKKFAAPCEAAVRRFVAGDAAGGLVEVGEGDVDDVRVAWVHRNVRPVRGGDGGWGAPGGTAVRGLDDVGGGRAGVEDDRVDAA